MSQPGTKAAAKQKAEEERQAVRRKWRTISRAVTIARNSGQSPPFGATGMIGRGSNILGRR